MPTTTAVYLQFRAYVPMIHPKVEIALEISFSEKLLRILAWLSHPVALEHQPVNFSLKNVTVKL